MQRSMPESALRLLVHKLLMKKFLIGCIKTKHLVFEQLILLYI